MNAQAIKVMIVEDSQVSAELLEGIINSDPELKVISKVESGEKALELLEKYQPDVMTVDICLPKMSGFDLIQKVMSTRPIPIVVITGKYSASDIEKAFETMGAGALSIFEKPRGCKDPNFQVISKEICRQIKLVSQVKLVTRKPVQSNQLNTHSNVNNIELVAIGGSLGGPEALRTILTAIPREFPVPIVIVQHISPNFLKGLIHWLQPYTQLQLCLPNDREVAKPGSAYFAPDRHNMTINSDLMITLDKGKGTDKIQPSAGKLFRSVAKNFGPRSVGVILTGMGRDGAQEMLEMKQQGAITIAQNKETSVMFGMPGEAIKLGAVDYVLPLEEIAQQVMKLVC